MRPVGSVIWYFGFWFLSFNLPGCTTSVVVFGVLFVVDFLLLFFACCLCWRWVFLSGKYVVLRFWRDQGVAVAGIIMSQIMLSDTSCPFLVLG